MNAASRIDAGTKSPGDAARLIWRRRELLGELVKRDLIEAYAGSFLSRGWAILHPILLIGLFLFVFGYVFVTRLGAQLPVVPDFAVFLLAGLTAWLTVQAALAKGTVALTSASNLVKQVVFPIELLPVKSVLSAQVPVLIGVVIVTVYSFLRFQIVSPLLPLVFFVLAAQTILLLGIVFMLSALNVFVRDTKDFITFFSSFGMFLLPIIYVPGSLPPAFNVILYLNPFSYAIWCFQDIFFFRSFEHPFAWLALGLLAIAALTLGLRFFERTRGSFGDAL